MHRWLIVACALVLAGCGASAKPHPAAKPRATQADRMKAVVRNWSTDLDTGQYAKLSHLFRLPATLIQGPYEYRLLTAKQVARWHSSLPCAGHIVSIKVSGRFASAVFRLGNRKGVKCDAPGTLAAARFFIVNGKIVSWQQIAPPSSGPVA